MRNTPGTHLHTDEILYTQSYIHIYRYTLYYNPKFPVSTFIFSEHILIMYIIPILILHNKKKNA